MPFRRPVLPAALSGLRARPSRPALAAVALVAAAAPVIPIVGGGASPRDLSAPSAVAASTVGSVGTVGWRRPSTSVAYFTVTARDGGRYAGSAYACGGCSSVRWPGLVLGHTYTFTVTATRAGGVVSSAASSPAVVPTAGDCGTDPRVACAAVAGGTPASRSARLPLGLLDDAVTAATPAVALADLGAGALRLDSTLADRGPLLAAMRPGTTSSEVLESGWYAYQLRVRSNACPAHGHVPANPWDDWNRYDGWVRGFVRAEVLAGRTPTYWDVINEPSASSFRVDSACSQAPSVDLLEQLLVHAYGDIKAVDPTAKVLAPSMSYVGEANLLDSPRDGGLVALNHLLTTSDAAGVRWDGIAYHELSGAHGSSSDADFEGTPQAVTTHLTAVRGLLAMHASARSAALFVNEIDGTGPLDGSPAATQELNLVPGRAVSLLAAAATGGADGVGLACWADGSTTGPSDCFNGTLDGLLDPYTGARRSVYWADQRSSCLTGRYAELPTNDASITGWAATDRSTVRMLLGRFDYSAVAKPTALTTRVAVPAGLGPVAAVTVQAIPSSLTAASVLPPAATTTVPVTGGAVTVPVAVAANAAYEIVVRPVGTALSACDALGH